MPDQSGPADRTPAQREADHASLARLADTLVPALVAKLTASGLGELEIREGEWKVRVRRPPGGAGGAGARRQDRPRIGLHTAAAEAHRPPAARPAAQAEAADPRRAVALSPTVGMFRPGLSVGAKVRAGDRIAVVDLLGIPQDVTAPIDGTLVEIYPDAGEAVEYGEEIAAVEADPEPRPADDDAAAEG
jgi:biotin carboxyl carrier protein